MFPQFLGIGAMKSGTSWLHVNLKQHPEIWLPPKKEIHFFDTRDLPWSAQRSHYSVKAPGDRYRRKRLKNELKRRQFRSVWWHLNYYHRRRTERWYRSLFPGPEAGVTGDITPLYGTLDHDQVRRMAGLMPRAKLIFLIREPVSRAWSHLRWTFRTQGPALRAGGWTHLSQVPLDVIAESLDSPGHSLSGDYARTLRTYGAHFPREQFLVAFLDDIKADPSGLLDRVLTFLGVQAGGFHWPESGQVQKQGDRVELTADLRALLEERERGRVEVLRQVLPEFGVTRFPAWLEEAPAGT